MRSMETADRVKRLFWWLTDRQMKSAAQMFRQQADVTNAQYMNLLAGK